MTERIGVVLSVAAALTLGGCVGFPSGGPSPTEMRFQAAVRAVEADDYVTAREMLTELASRCESGDRGRRAVLLLSTLALDARNPDADPDHAADLAGAYMALPEAPSGEVALARTLYLLALDQGAGMAADDTVAAEETPAPRTARRFSRCEEPVVEREQHLPTYPGPTRAARLDSLAAEGAVLRQTVDSLSMELDSARTQLAELEAELERIRKLLRGGGGLNRIGR